MEEVYYTIGAFMVVIGLVLFVVNTIQQGFFWKFLKVKFSKGRLVLVEVMGSTRSYFVTGEVSEGELVYKDSSKLIKRAGVTNNNFIRRWGVDSAYVDEEKNGIIDFRRGFMALEGYDSSKADRYVSRVLTMPFADNLKLIIIVGLVVVLIAAGVGAYYAYQASGQLAMVPGLIESVKVVCDATVI